MNFDTVFEKYDRNGDKKVDTLDEIRHLMFTDVLGAVGNSKYIRIGSCHT